MELALAADANPRLRNLADDKLWENLTNKQKEKIEAVAVDMWPAFANAIKTNTPQAEIVHDRFHSERGFNC